MIMLGGTFKRVGHAIKKEAAQQFDCACTATFTGAWSGRKAAKPAADHLQSARSG
jgi:hypothetical protein